MVHALPVTTVSTFRKYADNIFFPFFVKHLQQAANVYTLFGISTRKKFERINHARERRGAVCIIGVLATTRFEINIPKHYLIHKPAVCSNSAFARWMGLVRVRWIAFGNLSGTRSQSMKSLSRASEIWLQTRVFWQMYSERKPIYPVQAYVNVLENASTLKIHGTTL